VGTAGGNRLSGRKKVVRLRSTVGLRGGTQRWRSAADRPPAPGGGVVAEVVPLIGPRYGPELPVAKVLLGHEWAKIDGLDGKLLSGLSSLRLIKRK